MEPRNQTFITEFIFVGFPYRLESRVLFFTGLFLIYSITIFGNILISIAVIISPKLHLPMYFFLCNLSFLDVCYLSSWLPKAMVEVFYRKRTISVIGCMVQMNTTVFLGGTESFLLAVMAYDRYVAICFPLHYTTIMSRKNCRNITIVMWSGSLLTIVVPSNLRPMLFCLENKLDHFACETMAVQALECGDLTFHKVTRFVVSFIALVVPLVYIIVSYILIILSILKIKSTDGRFKAFSTCASHLTVVSMFYGTTIAMYIWPIKMFSSHLKYIAVVYGIITPMLNPLIYSLRNNDVKEAFKKIITTIFN